MGCCSMLIAVEGIDGAGKDTLAAGLARELSARGVRVVVTGEPSEGPIGRIIREMLGRGQMDQRIAALLFAADRLWHFENVIKPALANCHMVITVRYVESSVAYQGAAGVPIEWIEAINPVPRPDMTILIDVPVEEALRRIAGRARLDVFERREYLERVREIYLARARKIGAVVLDGTRPPSELVAEALNALRTRCPLP